MRVDLIVVRHGRTAWNREVRFRGRMDLPLDQVGRAQAEAAADAVAARWPGVAAVYSSPLLRARQTARPIAEALGQTVRPDEGLLDIDYGAWTGLSPAEAEQQDGARYHRWLAAPQQVTFPEGESLSDVQGRLVDLLRTLSRAHAGGQVVLVGHLVVNRVLFCTLLGLSLAAFWRIGQETAAINRARYADGTGQVLAWNDTCHLSTDRLEEDPDG